MLTKSDMFVSVSVGDDVVKVAQFKGVGANCKVQTIGVHALAGMTEAEQQKAVQSTLQKCGAKSANVVCVIPPGMVTAKNIEIPSTDKDEIKSIVSLQAGRHTPFSREEIQIAHINLGTHKENYTRVLLVIINKPVLIRQLMLIERNGIKVRRVLFAPEGIAAFYSQALGLASEATPTGIIDVGKETTDFIITFKGLPITSRSIPLGKTLLAAEPAEAQKSLLDEFTKTIEAYQTDDIGPLPAQYILTTDDAHTQGLKALLKEKNGWNAEVIPYVDNAKVAQGVLKRLAKDDPDSSFLDVIGAGSTVRTAQVDLMPEEVQLKKSIEDQGREVFRAAIFGFILLVLVSCVLGFKLYFRNSFLTKLADDYRDNRAEVADLQKQSKRIQVVRSYLANRMSALDVLQEFYQRLPKEVYLTSVIIDKDGNVSIQGVSDTASLVFNLGTILKESALFTNVEIKSTTAKKDRGKDASAFEITLKIKDENEQTEKTEQAPTK